MLYYVIQYVKNNSIFHNVGEHMYIASWAFIEVKLIATIADDSPESVVNNLKIRHVEMNNFVKVENVVHEECI